MNNHLEEKFLAILKLAIVNHDPSHDYSHTVRVLNLARKIQAKEGGSWDIIMPAVIFHDVVFYPKNSVNAEYATQHSADFAEQALLRFPKEYPPQKSLTVQRCIYECSYSKGLKPTSLESSILQDADRLEATGAISIMRTFASCGAMNLPLYNTEDPFYQKELPERQKAGLDLFYTRLLRVEKEMNTRTARLMAKGRTKLLRRFITQFKEELKESGVYND